MIRRKKIRTLYKIFSFSVPVAVFGWTMTVAKAVDSCFGGCPYQGDTPVIGHDGQTYYQSHFGPDPLAFLVPLAMTVLWTIFLVYFPWTFRAEAMRRAD